MIRKIALAAVYTGLCLGANAAVAQDVGSQASGAQDMAALDGLRTGDMARMEFVASPEAAPLAVFYDETGEEMTVADFAGQYVVLNFWATWCAPCRVEMPYLAALQDAMGSDAFRVVTVATGRNSEMAMANFFDEIGVTNLPLYRDPQQALAAGFGVLGLPLTVILDPQGRELARMIGEADWAGDDAMTLLAALVEG